MASDARLVALGPYRALRHRFAVHLPEGPLSDWLRGALAPLRHDESPDDVYELTEEPPGTWRLAIRDQELLHASTSSTAILPLLFVDVNRRAARSSNEHLVLHAGVLGTPRGAVIVPATSGAGKSTLTVTASVRGMAYGGDEHAAIHHGTGLVECVLKPAALKTGSAPRFRHLSDTTVSQFFDEQILLRAPDFAARLAPPTQSVTAVVFPDRRDDVDAAVLTELGPAQAVMTLRQNAFNFSAAPERSFETLVRLARSTPSYRLTYRDAESAVAILLTTKRDGPPKMLD